MLSITALILSFPNNIYMTWHWSIRNIFIRIKLFQIIARKFYKNIKNK